MARAVGPIVETAAGAASADRGQEVAASAAMTVAVSDASTGSVVAPVAKVDSVTEAKTAAREIETRATGTASPGSSVSQWPTRSPNLKR